MKTWCRVNTRKNKCPRDVAEEQANIHVIKLLQQYELTGEAVCAAYACDILKLKEILSKQGKAIFNAPQSWNQLPLMFVLNVIHVYILYSMRRFASGLFVACVSDW